VNLLKSIFAMQLRMLMDEARCRQLKFHALDLFTVEKALLFTVRLTYKIFQSTDSYGLFICMYATQIVGSAISYLVVISQLQKE
jgi:hypothetical protein